MITPWFLLAALSLATFVFTHLIVYLDFPPVLWLRDRIVGGWRPLTMKEAEQLRSENLPEGVLGYPVKPFVTTDVDGIPNRWVARSDQVPFFFAELMSCPWCVGAWAAAALTAGSALTVGIPAPLLMWLAVWALGSLLSSRDWV